MHSGVMSLQPYSYGRSRRSPEYIAVCAALSAVKRRGIVASHVARAAVARAQSRAGDNLAGKTATEKALIKAVGAMKVNVKKWASAATVDDLLAADAIAAMDVALAAAALRLSRPGKPCDVDELAAKFAAELVEVAEIKELRAAEAEKKRKEGYVTTTTYNVMNGAGELVERTQTFEFTPEYVAERKRLEQERKDQPLEERNPKLYEAWTAAPGATVTKAYKDTIRRAEKRLNYPKRVIKQDGLIKFHRDGTFSVASTKAECKVETIYFLTREEAVEHLAELRRESVLPPARQPHTLPENIIYDRTRASPQYRFGVPSSYGRMSKIHKKLTKLKIKRFYYFPVTDVGLEAAKTFKKAMLAWLEGPKTTPPPSPP